MRDNGPTTGREVILADEHLLVSRTDVNGQINFVNEAFTAISGFSQAELIGAPHNIVRHPDMPKQAFADLWRTIKVGHPWDALVKNRTKAGDHYWVCANVTPVVENGEVTGFISIRSKPAREAVAEAERVYAAIRAGTTQYSLSEGQIVQRGMGQWVRAAMSSIASRLVTSLVLLSLGVIGLGVLALPGEGGPPSLVLVAGLVLICLAVAATAGVSVLATVKRPLRLVGEHLDAIASGDLLKPIASSGVAEFTSIRAQLRAVKAKLGYTIQERAERQRQSDAERVAALRGMAETVEREAGQAVELVVSSTAAMAQDSDNMASSAERVSTNAGNVAAAAEEALANAQTVAAATEELAASIREISSQIAHSSTVTRRGVETGERTQGTIRSLSDSVGRIGAVVQLINGIARQTNLLALNATIEAARAGDAGRGFAVVAQEVKNLANQTARSTDDITHQIADIQAATATAVAAVEEIGGTIGEIDRISVAIAAAMEEQAGATQEISRNVIETSAAAQEVATRIAAVSLEAEQTGAQAANVRHGSGAIADSIASLQRVLVRVVRTSTTDADRRRKPRFHVDEPAVITVGGRAQPCRVANLSTGGAMIAGTEGIEQAERGTLRLDRHGVQTGFEIRGLKSGVIHAKFLDTDPALPAFQAVVERLIHGLRPIDAAA